MAIRASHIFPSLLFACAAGATHGAELGEARVASHIGQQLVADVELTMIEDAADKVGVRLAHPDVYRGANIAMPAVLSGLDLNVMRQGGRQFLHLTTLKPVESRHLHVYLELVDGGQRSVRLVTLWLTPDPNPAPPPAPLPVARPAAALHEGEEYVEEGARPLPAALPRRPAAKPVATARKAPEKKAAPAAPLAVPARPESPPAACAPQPATAQIEACTALGEKNAALRHELGQLEAKVKVLQVATGDAPAVVPALATTPAPKGAPRIQPKPKKPAPPEPETPWGVVGAALAATLALAGLGVALLRRRQRSTFGKIPKEHKPSRLPKAEAGAPDAAPKPSFMSAVKARLASRKKPAPEPVEPALENVEN